MSASSLNSKGMLRQPAPDDRVIHLLLAGALDDKPDENMIAGNRSVTNGPNGV